MRVAGAMVLQALHISNVPALPIGSIFMPVSRQLLATGPTVACHSVCVSVCWSRFGAFLQLLQIQLHVESAQAPVHILEQKNRKLFM